MNNEELKKKILTIVRGAMLEADELPFIETTDNIADALIAAGIGDVKEAEHRAEKEERALNCLARSFAEAMCKYGDDPHYLVDGFIQDAYSQAEKELAEERKE